MNCCECNSSYSPPISSCSFFPSFFDSLNDFLDIFISCLLFFASSFVFSLSCLTHFFPPLLFLYYRPQRTLGALVSSRSVMLNRFSPKNVTFGQREINPTNRNTVLQKGASVMSPLIGGRDFSVVAYSVVGEERRPTRFFRAR